MGEGWNRVIILLLDLEIWSFDLKKYENIYIYNYIYNTFKSISI